VERAWHPETGCDRLVALSDGIFSVALTLGTVEIMPPGLHHRLAVEGVAAVLRDLQPQFIWAAVTFFIVGIYWTSHHRIFSYIRRTDETFLTLNILFLLCVTLMPFSIELVQVDEPLAVGLYAGFLGVFGLLQNRLWAYATRKHRLVDAGLSAEIIRYNSYRSLMAPLVFFASIALIPWSLNAARLFWLLLAFSRRACTRLAQHPPKRLQALLAA
jgi:uncharacterized membrane protein